MSEITSNIKPERKQRSIPNLIKIPCKNKISVIFVFYLLFCETLELLDPSFSSINFLRQFNRPLWICC